MANSEYRKSRRHVVEVSVGKSVRIVRGLQVLERVALTCSQYCTVSLHFFAEKRLHILRNCSKPRISCLNGILQNFRSLRKSEPL